MQLFGDCILISILNAAMVADMLTGKIRNGLILTGLALGLFCQLWVHGTAGIPVFAAGVFLPFVGTFPLFAFGAVGAGDVKLLAVIGGFLGMAAMPRCLFFTLVFGAVAAVLKMLFQGSLYRRFVCLASYVEQSIRGRCWMPYKASLHEEQAVIHLSAPMLFAVLTCMLGGVA